jgi:uncharacterized protein YgiM (DUF1202 family)
MKRLPIFISLFGALILSANTNKNIYAAVIEEGIAGISITLDNVTPVYYWTTDTLNIRLEPTTNSNIIYTLSKRSKIVILTKTSSKWVQIKYNDFIGYVYSAYLRDTELPKLKFTDKEIEVLERITEAECEGQSLEAKMNVISVVINRIIHIDFPDDLISVVHQDNQFSPIGSKRYEEITISQDTKDAINEVLKNGVINEALYFCNKKYMTQTKIESFEKGLEFLFKDDSGHSFYK